MNRPKVVHFPGITPSEDAASIEQESPIEGPVAEILPHDGPEKRVGPPDRRAPDRGRPRLGKAVARDLSRDEEILKIAVEVVWRRGFAGTKLSDIAEAAGIVKGSLYHYFDSKEEIYARLVNNVRSLFEGEADQLATGSAIERLEHFIRSRVAVILEHPLEIALLNRDLVRMKGAIGDWAREGPKKNFAAIRKIILQGQKEGVFRAADPDLVSSMILGVLAHVPNWYHREHPAQPDELTREVLEYALGGIVTSIDLIPKRG
jgi:TetR/AcrR family transcriptional regulator, cholesterol catabolism regulator